MKKIKGLQQSLATTIEEIVTIPSIEDLCLPEECIAMLNTIGIPIVDGSIMLGEATYEQYAAYS